jgi:hypothetical protein
MVNAQNEHEHLFVGWFGGQLTGGGVVSGEGQLLSSN